ncbi:MAG: DUF1501 domain-containing protein, partial [bacterium]|nr:DUF1501 domain-containing protein [bacterium]
MNSLPDLSRRQWLASAGGGLGMLAMQALAAEELHGSEDASKSPLAPKKPHFKAKAKRVLWLFMHGGPSQVDLFDPKPALTKFAGKPLPESFGEVMTRRKVAQNPLLGPMKKFRKHGKSGIEI